MLIKRKQRVSVLISDKADLRTTKKDYQNQTRTLRNSSRRKNNPECVYTPKLELQNMGGKDNIGLKVVRLVLLCAGVAENT